MDKIELYKKYIAVVEMCKGTSLEDTPWVCVKIDGNNNLECHPRFDSPHTWYDFAVSILEDKPVFVGDVVYGTHAGSRYTVTDKGYCWPNGYSITPFGSEIHLTWDDQRALKK